MLIFLIFARKFPDFRPQIPFECKVMQDSIIFYSCVGLRTSQCIKIDLKIENLGNMGLFLVILGQGGGLLQKN